MKTEQEPRGTTKWEGENELKNTWEEEHKLSGTLQGDQEPRGTRAPTRCFMGNLYTIDDIIFNSD